MGKAKDVNIYRPAYENKAGGGEFTFTDRYSIFDYGTMPDRLPNKGRSLAVMSQYNFEECDKRGIRHHSLGLDCGGGGLGPLGSIPDKSNGSGSMVFNAAVVYTPVERRIIGDKDTPQTTYDYSFFETNRGNINNYLLPLEVIFRNGLPRGSSVFKRIAEAKAIANPQENEAALQKIYEKIGVREEPKPGDMLPKPIVGYTTKWEAGDRHLSDEEALRISGLREEYFEKIGPFALSVDNLITQRAEEVGLGPHWDGKIELVWFNCLVLADVAGTLDEDRFGQDLSKEFLRQWYDQNQPEFHKACDEWKKIGDGWQGRCPVKPVQLPEDIVKLVSDMYMAAANAWVGRGIFEAPDLSDVILAMQNSV